MKPQICPGCHRVLTVDDDGCLPHHDVRSRRRRCPLSRARVTSNWWSPDQQPPASVRTLSGGLPTLGRRR
jgi:hypothetical protein